MKVSFYLSLRGAVVPILFLVSLLVPHCLIAQQSIEEKQLLCKKENENLEGLKYKRSKIPKLYFYDSAILYLKDYSYAPTDFDDKTLDKKINDLMNIIEGLKKDIRFYEDQLANKDPESGHVSISEFYEHWWIWYQRCHWFKISLRSAQGVSDFLRQIKVKRIFGETVNQHDNPVLKTIIILEKEKVNIEGSIKLISNDIKKNEERILQLGCSEPLDWLDKLISKYEDKWIGTNADDFDYSKISVTWQSSWGPVTLSVSKSSVSGSWKQSTTQTGQITGGSFDAKTKTLKFTYSQAWNKKTGKVTLVFSETPTGYSLSGSWSHDDGSGSGSWSMNRGK